MLSIESFAWIPLWAGGVQPASVSPGIRVRGIFRVGAVIQEAVRRRI